MVEFMQFIRNNYPDYYKKYINDNSLIVFSMQKDDHNVISIENGFVGKEAAIFRGIIAEYKLWRSSNKGI
jgi:hypothetical protein